MVYEDIYKIKDWIDHEFKFRGKYGKKGEKRSPRAKATPEQIRKQNQKNREKRMTRLIRANFEEGDYWLTLKYKKGDRPGVDQLVSDFDKFQRKMRTAYKKEGEPYKYIYRMEIGDKGGVHIHILVNRINGIGIKEIQDKWKCGRIHAATIYKDNGFKDLAEYICKLPNEVQEQQISIFLEHGKKFIKINSSRNLLRPEPERKLYRRRTLEKAIREGIKPKDGYRVIPDTVCYGLNPFTGYTYLHYTEEKLRKEDPPWNLKTPPFT